MIVAPQLPVGDTHLGGGVGIQPVRLEDFHIARIPEGFTKPFMPLYMLP